MVRIALMASQEFPLNRRKLIAGLGAAALGPALPLAAMAQGRRPLELRAKADKLVLRASTSDTTVWSLAGPPIRFKRGETIDLAFANDLPAPAMLDWRGLDGVAAAQPVLGHGPLAPGGKATFQVPLRHAGTLLCDLLVPGDGAGSPLRGLPVIVSETETVAVDRDEVVLIEEWRLRPDGTAVPAGVDPKDASPAFTVNGQSSLDLKARPQERLRFRFINVSQRTVIAVKLRTFDMTVMAIDGHPAEPFPARNGALVLAPGGRADAFIDVTSGSGPAASILLHDGKEARLIGRLMVAGEPMRPASLPPAPPLPSNGLPEKLDLKNAQRFDIALGGPQPDWTGLANFNAAAAPAFRIKPGRTVVLALTNRAQTATVFRVQGHHFRLLDRLDDGWKPFWLDTLAVEPGQTQRIAFSAEHAGRFLIEQVATDWAAPRLLRWYNVG